jgi:pimeloyl-ACP methyl ester carboxylesterase
MQKTAIISRVMLHLAHTLLVLTYAVIPLAAAVRAAALLQRHRVRPAMNLMLTIAIGSALATVATTVYAVAVDGHVGIGQFALAIYFAIGVLLILNLLDSLVRSLVRKIGRGTVPMVVSAVLRAGVLVGLGLPYIVAAAMTYRPRVTHPGDPATLLRRAYSDVQFQTSDGIGLSGWWIPASTGRGFFGRTPDFGAKTVIVCHGFGADKATQLIVARRLIPAGYNVLAFDFRAYGDSGGRFSTLGDIERRDVLAAVHWVRTEHPQQAKRIVGIGIGIGAAALIGAATDPSQDGQSIESLVLYGAYDDLSLLADTVMQDGQLPVMDWLLPRVGLPLASLHAGANLAAFKPAALIPQLWPRPVFVIHGAYDRIVPFERGQSLFNAASFPKQYLWLMREDLDDTLRDDEAAGAVLDFFETAKAMPVI